MKTPIGKIVKPKTPAQIEAERERKDDISPFVQVGDALKSAIKKMGRRK